MLLFLVGAIFWFRWDTNSWNISSPESSSDLQILLFKKGSLGRVGGLPCRNGVILGSLPRKLVLLSDLLVAGCPDNCAGLSHLPVITGAVNPGDGDYANIIFGIFGSSWSIAQAITVTAKKALLVQPSSAASEGVFSNTLEAICVGIFGHNWAKIMARGEGGIGPTLSNHWLEKVQIRGRSPLNCLGADVLNSMSTAALHSKPVQPLVYTVLGIVC